MNYNTYGGILPPSLLTGPMASVFLVLLTVAILWTIVWKGLALWHAARNRQTAWFVILLIVNSLGILEIVYLTFFRKNHNDKIVTTTVTHTTTTSASTPSPAAEPPSAPTA